MTPGLTLTLIGLGLGTLITVGGRSSPRETSSSTSLRDRAIEAQRISARAAEVARDLAERLTKEA